MFASRLGYTLVCKSWGMHECSQVFWVTRVFTHVNRYARMLTSLFGYLCVFASLLGYAQVFASLLTYAHVFTDV